MNEEIAKSQFEVPAKEATKRAEIYAAAVPVVLKRTDVALAISAIGVIVHPAALSAWVALIVVTGVVSTIAFWCLSDRLHRS